MIAVDTSALVAILLKEEDALSYARAMENASALCLSVASLVELHRVAKGRKGSAGRKIIESLVEKAQIEIVSVTEAQAKLALEATWAYPVLNYGDVFSYALAKERNIPLLFKGNDFQKTDIQSLL